jgi:hypothetical protein
VTSLDVCDELGLSGLTISSDDNCLVITGGVTFEYDIGRYQDAAGDGRVYGAFVNHHNGNQFTVYDPGIAFPDTLTDSNADVDAWLKFVATANTDFGPATATIKLISENGNGSVDQTVGIDEAWVGIGDTTTLMAGYKSSIFNAGDDGPLNYLGLFNSESVNSGVGFVTDGAATGGDVIQVVSQLGNGLVAKGGLENLGGLNGGLTGVGVLAYAGDNITAHVSTAVGAGWTNAGWKLHAGFTGAWDPIKVVGAVSADDTGYWDALGSVAATFDMFTLAASGEATSAGEWGVGGSAVAKVTDSVTLNLGGRYFHGVSAAGTHGTANPYDLYQVEAGVVAAVTETLSITGAVGYTDSTITNAEPTPGVFYGNAGVIWSPGGGFSSSASVGANSLGGYKAVFKAAKTIK